MNPAWSYVLTLVGVTGLLIAGRKKAFGWVIGFAAQGLWATYGAVTQQHGFVISAFVYGYVYALNFWTWRRDKAEEPEELTPEQQLFKLAHEMLTISSPNLGLVDRTRYAEVLIKFSKTAAAWEEQNKPPRHKMPKTSRRR